MAPEPISSAYFISPPISLCGSICIPLIVTRQRLGKNVAGVTNTGVTIEEIWAHLFLCDPCSINGK
jgi:hypothetical protein